MSKAAKMVAKVMLENVYHAYDGLGKYSQGMKSFLQLSRNNDKFGLGYVPTRAEKRRLFEIKKLKKMTPREYREIEKIDKTIPHLYHTFRSAGCNLNEGRCHEIKVQESKQLKEAFDDLSINAIGNEESQPENASLSASRRVEQLEDF